MKPATNRFQYAPAHATLCQCENERSLSHPKLNNASWGYNHSIHTPLGLGEVLPLWPFTPNRVTSDTFTILEKGDATTYPWPASFDEVGAPNNE